MHDECSPNTGPTCPDGETCGSFPLLPTPTVNGNYNRKGLSPASGDGLFTALTSSAAGSRVSRSAWPAVVWRRRTNDGSGPSSPESFALYDPDTCSWKTCRGCLFADSETFSETWPRSGTMRSGQVFRLSPLVRLISAGASSLLPTVRPCSGKRSSGANRTEIYRALDLLPTPNTPNGGRSVKHATRQGRTYLHNGKKVQLGLEEAARMLRSPGAGDGARGAQHPDKRKGHGLRLQDQILATPTARDWKSGAASLATLERNSRPLTEQLGGRLNPRFVEQMMSFPAGWTDLKDSETP